MTGFVAVVRAGSPTGRPALVAAGAVAVLSWGELATSTEPDDVPAVLFDLPVSPDPAAVLSMLASLGPPAAAREVVIATVRPVVDTLKLVDGGGVLTGTAQREEHRFVGTPIAARLGVLRAVSRELAGSEPASSTRDAAGSGPTAGPSTGPTAVAVLAALVERGATVFASRP